MVELIATLILAASFFFFFLNRWKKSKNSKSKKLLPPGPRKLPIIGNLHQMRNPPFRCLRDLSNQHGPLMHLKLGERSAIIVSSPKLAKQMLKDLDPCFAQRPEYLASKILWYAGSDIGFSPYGEYWRQMRKFCVNELLSTKMVRLFQSIREDESARLVKSLRESSGSSVNFTEKLFSLSSSITFRAAFGAACKDNGALRKMIEHTMEMVGGFEMLDLFPSSRLVAALSWRRMGLLKTMRRELDVIMDDIIDRHRRNRGRNSEFGGEDLVDVILRAQEEDLLHFPIDNNNIKAVLYDVFTAGTDTSAATIEWTMVELLRHPPIMDKVQSEVRRAFMENPSFQQDDVVYDLKYLKLVIKESLRLHPPGPILPRASIEEQVINGYTIPAGAMVMVNNWAMQRDPRYWKNPERFEPERFETEDLNFVAGDCKYSPFGIGRRMCPGLTFGLAAVEAALIQLLYNFDWKLPKGLRAEDLDMTENAGLTATRKQHLFVVVTPYK